MDVCYEGMIRNLISRATEYVSTKCPRIMQFGLIWALFVSVILHILQLLVHKRILGEN